MKICPYCHNSNREGYLFCEDCGQSLHENDTVTMTPTREMDETTQNLYDRTNWGTARFGKNAVVVLHIRDAPEPVTLKPNARTILGRSDANTTQRPDIDLSPYGAIDKGVSRTHAMIYRNEDTLVLMDMGSSNGTHLNGQRLVPEQPRVLRDGDEIRLGKLVIHIYFKSSAAA